MKFSDYMKDNQITLLVCFAGGLFFSVLLLAFGISLSEMALLWVCFAIIVFFTMFAYFRKQQKRIQYLLETMETLDKKYLIAEIADRPETELEKIYFRLLKTALKSMTDEVTEIRRLNVEYKDFIEQWIHEIKVPITGVQLLCENNKTEIMRKIIAQTELMEQSIEKVLFYARLGSVEKDYLIKAYKQTLRISKREQSFSEEELDLEFVQKDIQRSKLENRLQTTNGVYLAKNQLLQPAIDLVFANKESHIDLGTLASAANVSSSYLSRLLKEEFGEPFSKMYGKLKVYWAKELLETTDWSIAEISDALGYVEPSYFIRSFKKITGVTPLNYRKDKKSVDQ